MRIHKFSSNSLCLFQDILNRFKQVLLLKIFYNSEKQQREESTVDMVCIYWGRENLRIKYVSTLPTDYTCIQIP
jgi:hypothetical protein